MLYLLIASRTSGEMGLKVIELLQEVLLREVAILLGPDVPVVLKHPHDLHVLNLAGQLLDFFLQSLTFKGGRHSTEVAFMLHAQPARVQISAL